MDGQRAEKSFTSTLYVRRSVIATIILLTLIGWMVCTTAMALFPSPAARKERNTASPTRRSMGAHLSLPPTPAGERAKR